MGDFAVQIEAVGTEKLIAKFDGYVGKLRGQLTTAMQKIVNTIVNFIQEEELSGQVLHARTGTLRRSIKGTVEDEPAQIIGEVTSRDKGNAPLAYALIHEKGGVIHMPARTATIYRFISKNGSVGGFVKKKKSNFATDHHVGAHDIHIPARPYFEPAKEAKKAYAREMLEIAVNMANQ